MSCSTGRTVSFAVVALCVLAVSASAAVVENLTADVGRGFGSNWNRYAWSLAEFQGQEYVGTWNVQADYAGFARAILSGQVNLQDLLSGQTDLLSLTGLLSSRGGEIWRHDGNGQWTQVHKSAPQDMGFRNMVVHNNTLYAASANYSAGASILTSQNGTDWAPLTGGPMNNPNNTSVRTMLSHGNVLYVGTENAQGAELWAYNTRTSTWRKKEVFREDAAVAELTFFDGRLYVGTWDFQDHYRLHSSRDTRNWTDVTPEFAGSDQLHNFGVMQLREFDGQLYLGTVNYFEGFTLLRSGTPNDPRSWDVITTDGMGDPDNAYAWSSAVWEDKLYIGTFNHGIRGGVYSPLLLPLDGRAQLLSSEDGLNWSSVIDDGFGSPFTYGIRTMMVNSKNQLVCGTASNFLVVDPLSDPALANADWTTLQQTLVQMLGPEDAARILQMLAGLANSNWIGCEVYTVTAPEPATWMLIAFTVPLMLRRRARITAA